MKKLIIYLLCCVVLVSMVGCGSNTAPPPTESPPTMVLETVITETPLETTPLVTAVESTEKDPVTTEREGQVTEPTVVATEPTTIQPTEETTTTATSTIEEMSTPPIVETVPSTAPQLTEKETTETAPPKDEPKAETESPKLTEPEPTEKPAPFDINHWIAYARSYAVNKGLILSDTAVDCWDNPICADTQYIPRKRYPKQTEPLCKGRGHHRCVDLGRSYRQRLLRHLYRLRLK